MAVNTAGESPASDRHLTACDQCGGFYLKMQSHWANSTSCSWPILTERFHILVGLTLAGARFPDGTGQAAPSMLVTHDDRQALASIGEKLGSLTLGIRETDVKKQGAYELQLCNHPVYAALDAHFTLPVQERRTTPDAYTPTRETAWTLHLLCQDEEDGVLRFQRPYPKPATLREIFSTEVGIERWMADELRITVPTPNAENNF